MRRWLARQVVGIGADADRSGGSSADGAINACLRRDFDRALVAARAADCRAAAGERRPLLGIPITVKESYNIAGLPTTWAFLRLRISCRPRRLAIVRVKAAGRGGCWQTNVPFPLAISRAQRHLRATANPWDLGCTPGGSSGGSAAALAAPAMVHYRSFGHRRVAQGSGAFLRCLCP